MLNDLPVFLGQLYRFLDDSFQFIVVSELSVAGKRKVFAQRVSLKSKIIKQFSITEYVIIKPLFTSRWAIQQICIFGWVDLKTFL